MLTLLRLAKVCVACCRFVPVQRWSHNVEHGAVVMAYNPCLNPDTVDRLRKLVTGCIRWTAELLSHISVDLHVLLRCPGNTSSPLSTTCPRVCL